MNFPGDNELKLTHDAVCQAIEGALNAQRKDGEDYIRVTNVANSYSYGPFVVTMTTDAPKADVVSITTGEVAA